MSPTEDIDGDGRADFLAGSFQGGAAYLVVAVEISEEPLRPAAPAHLFGWSSALGDLNGDESGDALVSGHVSGLYLFYGPLSGGRTEDSRIEFPNPVRYANVAACDGDGDGAVEFLVGVVAPGDTAGGLYKVTETGLHAVSDGYEGESGLGAEIASLGDVDGDGLPDLGVASYDAVHVLFGDTVDPYSRESRIEGNWRTYAGGDHDGDDFADIALTGPTFNHAFVFFGGPAGVELDPLELVPDGGAWGYVGWPGTALDFDSDGLDDLVLGAISRGTEEQGAALLFWGACRDLDEDGVCRPEDCDDADPSVRPGADDTCGDGVDSDCDGMDPACPDSGIDSAVDSATPRPPEPRCGCASGTPRSPPLLLPGLLLAALRRRGRC